MSNTKTLAQKIAAASTAVGALATDKHMKRFWDKVDMRSPDDCWLWTAGLNNHGYGNFWSKGRTVAAHRFAYEWDHGPISEGLQVNHKCDQPACVNPNHLYVGTQAENIRDRDEKCRAVDNSGEKNGMSKLTWTIAEEIRARHKAGEGPCALGREFGVTHGTIGHVVRGDTWKKEGDK